MNCLDRTALTEYLRGKLKPEELLDVSEHVFSCEKCKRELKLLESYAPAAAYVKDAAFGVTECPEYEELSVFVDGSLAGERLATVESHVSQCDFCRSDVVMMRSLRARAELAEQIVAKPVKFRSGFSWAIFPAWQKAAAGVAAAAIILGGVFFAAPRPQHIASNTGSEKPAVTKENIKPDSTNQIPGHRVPIANQNTPDSSKPQNEQVASNQGTGSDITIPNPPERQNEPDAVPGGSEKPASRPVEREESINFASLGIDGSLEARLERAYEQKMRTGSVDKPVMVAKLDTVRSGATSELAPVPVSPSKGVLRNSPKVLQWKPVDGAVSYRVTVQDEDGRTVVRETVEGTELALSETLDSGNNYRWLVESSFGAGTGWMKSRAVPFRVISSDENQAVERAEAKFRSRPEILGTIYESVGLYDDAVRQFERYAAANPSKLSRKMVSEAREKSSSMK